LPDFLLDETFLMSSDGEPLVVEVEEPPSDVVVVPVVAALPADVVLVGWMTDACPAEVAPATLLLPP
jgi:hypothetical protein